jgi:endonuclease/exonuclease/phosphatase family metal-dependent hydrolase
MVDMKSSLTVILAVILASCAPQPEVASSSQGRAVSAPLRLASWNLEFLAEKDGAGCEPRETKDYAAMKRIVDSLDADVIAFQEAENPAAAARVFDPAKYTIVMEHRPGQVAGTCGGRHPDQPFIRQAVGFAVRKGVAFDRNADVTSIMIGNPQLRSGVDITLMPKGQAPIRLLVVHLKSGCASGNQSNACPTLTQQIPAVEGWIDTAARRPVRFAVLGDWNRQLAKPGDPFWAEIDDGDPRNADLRLTDEGISPKCDPRYNTFIDHIVLDRRAGEAFARFNERPYAADEQHYSDHCPVVVTLKN